MSAKDSHDQPHAEGVDVLSVPPVHVISEEEGREIFDQQARRYLGMSGDEFLKAWDAGEFDDNPDQPEIMRVVMLLPLVR